MTRPQFFPACPPFVNTVYTKNCFLFWDDFAGLSCFYFTKRGWPFVFAPKQNLLCTRTTQNSLVCLRCRQTAVGRCTVTWLPNFLGWVDLLTHGAPLACAKRARQLPYNVNSIKSLLRTRVLKKGLRKETISCSFLKFVPNLSGRLSFFLGRSKAESSSSSLNVQGDKKNSSSWHLSWEHSAGKGDVTERHAFNKLPVCDFIGLKKVINKTSGLVQNMTLKGHPTPIFGK